MNGPVPRCDRGTPGAAGRLAAPTLNHMDAEKSTALPGILTVGSVADRDGLESLAGMNARDFCDVVEFRVDGFPDCPDQVAARMAGCGVPALLTVRDPGEGGMNALTAARRHALYRQLVPHAAFVDIEIRNLRAMEEIVHAARGSGVAIVASYHDFRGTPDPGVLRELADQARQEGADIVKFATVVKDSRDLFVLASLVESRGQMALSAMGMGPLGPVSRLLLARLGSRLNYGWLDRPTVPGQWPAGRLREVIRDLTAG